MPDKLFLDCFAVVGIIRSHDYQAIDDLGAGHRPRGGRRRHDVPLVLSLQRRFDVDPTVKSDQIRVQDRLIT